jgi:hypothetical protein
MKRRIKWRSAMRVWQGGILIALLARSVAFAGTDARERDVSSPGVLRQATMAIGAEPAGLGSWQARIRDAQFRQNRGRILQWSGAGVGAATILVTSLMARGTASCSTAALSSGPGDFANCIKPGNRMLALGLGGVASVALTAAGYAQRRGAHCDLDNLYQEGESKGYVSMGLTPGRGVQAAYTLSF